jgi:acyl-CoA synthetase (AMP-forming)/AMP-acid ligase II
MGFYFVYLLRSERYSGHSFANRPKLPFIVDYCSTNVLSNARSLQVPEEHRIRGELPKTISGNILRRELRERPS